MVLSVSIESRFITVHKIVNKYIKNRKPKIKTSIHRIEEKKLKAQKIV